MKVMAKKKSYGTIPQLERFKEAARMLGCDEDEATFEARLKKIANAPAPKKPVKAKKKKPA
jgi:hypothetical protein